MAKAGQKKQNGGASLSLKTKASAAKALSPLVHLFPSGFVCDTESRGFKNPNNRSPLELVIDAPEGFIALWAPNSILRWRFREAALQVFAHPEAIKAAVRELMGEALLLWGEAAPVRFAENKDSWDFQISVSEIKKCAGDSCVLASAFFPDTGRHEMVLYPSMFDLTREEQIETMMHELGHIFGLRHFFAQITESGRESVRFGDDDEVTIMNYGPKGRFTDKDKSDLKALYERAWSGKLTEINGAPIRFVRPYHTLNTPATGLLALADAAAATVQIGRGNP